MKDLQIYYQIINYYKKRFFKIMFFKNIKKFKIEDWPKYSRSEIKICKQILKSGKVNYWTGNETKKFEKEFEEYFNVKNAIAVANGSCALHAAYSSLDYEEGDEIITTPRTFIATASSAVNLRLKPIFADVDLNSGNITAESIAQKITNKTKCISVVHIAGWPAEMEKICDLAKANNLKVIEDCSQAHGALIKEKHVGSFGDLSCWSFCQDKIMTTGGEGGMVASNSDKYWKKLWSIKDHGKNLDLVLEKNNNHGFKWIHDDIGYNFRLTEMQSAIGRIQLNYLKKWSDLRRRNANILIEKLSLLSNIRIPLPASIYRHAWYKFYVYLKINALKENWSRNRIIEEIKQCGYPAFEGSCSEIYLEKAFYKLGLNPKERLPNAKKLGESSLMFVVHPSISKIQMYKYAEIIKKILLKAKN